MRARCLAHLVSIEEGRRRRIQIAQPGLFTTILLALFFGVVVAAMLALFLGTFPILVRAIIVIVFALRFGRVQFA